MGFFDFADAEEFCPDTEFRSTLLQISHRFREVALHTPSVWSIFNVSPGNVDRQLEEIPVYLPRSREYPLQIRLSCFWGADITEPIMKLFLPHSQRWRRLCMVTINSRVFEFLQHIPVPSLEDLNISFYSHERRTSLPSNSFGASIPRLSSLCLRNVNLHNLNISLRDLTTLEIRGYGIWPEFSEFSEMLSGSTSLQKLILHVKPGHVVHQQLFPGLENNPRGHITLPELRILEMYTSEWLSPGIVSLIRVFICPKLQSLILREGVGSASETSQTIMNYTAQAHLPRHMKLHYPISEPLCTEFSNRLFIHAANLSLACRTFPATMLTSLELRKVVLPSHMSMKMTLSSLKNLKHLFFLELSVDQGLLQMLDNIQPALFQETFLDDMQSTVEIPNLETLMVELSLNDSAKLTRDYTAGFIRIFSTPTLRSLTLKNLTAQQWKSVAASFHEHSSEYPRLTSLKLIDFTDVISTNIDHPSYYSVTCSFPHLHRLSLDGTSSNPFLQALIPASSTARTLPCPELQVLSICNDRHTSKPLLHRVITAREVEGIPLRKLCLDAHFSTNVESLGWIRQHVDICPAEVGFL